MQYASQRRLKGIVWRVIRTKFFDGVRPALCSLPVFKLEGKTQRTNCNLSAVVFAKKELAHYFSKISYAEEPEPKHLGKVSFNGISSIIASIKPDVAFISANSVFSDYLLSNNFFLMPYINHSLEISDSWNSILSTMHRSKRRIINRIEKSGYSYEITKEHKKLKLLYHEMYVPRISDKHGKSAEIVSFAECERMFRKGGLLFVNLDGKPVSGAIYVPHGDELYIPVLNTNHVDKHLKHEASAAALYFAILWARQQGFAKIDYGSSKPFFEDGGIQYKKEWGMKMNPIIEHDARVLAMKFYNFDKGTRDFISNSPFIVSENKELRGLAIFDSKKDLLNTYHAPGLFGLTVFCSAHESSQLKQQYKSISEVNSDQNSPLGSLLKIASEEGYKAYSLKF